MFSGVDNISGAEGFASLKLLGCLRRRGSQLKSPAAPTIESRTDSSFEMTFNRPDLTAGGLVGQYNATQAGGFRPMRQSRGLPSKMDPRL
jgi:hypothetical protein